MAADLNPPGPKSFLPGGQFFSIYRDPLGYFTRLAGEYGDLVHFRVGPQRCYLVNHPDFIRDVLVTRQDAFGGRFVSTPFGKNWIELFFGESLLTSEGDASRRRRALMQGAFRPQRSGILDGVINDCADRMEEGWRSGDIVDFPKAVREICLITLARTLLDVDARDEAGQFSDAFDEMLGTFGSITLPFAELLKETPLPIARRFRKAKEVLDGFVYHWIEKRRTARDHADDLISVLLRAGDSCGSHPTSDERIRNEVLTVILGLEGVVSTLAWTFHLLARNPEVETRLHSELDNVLRGASPTSSHLSQLPYAESVFSEVLRLFPPTWFTARRALDDFEIGGYRLPAGSLLFICQYVMHRDSRYYFDPLLFDPGRWGADKKDGRPEFSYFPFGAGGRYCMGANFAWMHGMLLLVRLAQRWRLRLAGDPRVAIQVGVTLRPRHGLLMRLERRDLRLTIIE